MSWYNPVLQYTAYHDNLIEYRLTTSFDGHDCSRFPGIPSSHLDGSELAAEEVGGHGQHGRAAGDARERAGGGRDVQVRVLQGLLGVDTVLKEGTEQILSGEQATYVEAEGMLMLWTVGLLNGRRFVG